MSFLSVEEALARFRSGQMLIVVDDEDRENEGDFVLAAEHASPEQINFMALHGRGLICCAITGETAARLDLSGWGDSSGPSLNDTHFTVSVDAVHGTTTGISASDRAKTVAVLAGENSLPAELARPGHMFPVVAVGEGVLKRRGHTEAVVDLARLAGLRPCGVMCEIMEPDGTMARLASLKQLARRHGLGILKIDDLVRHRLQREKPLRPAAEALLPLPAGEFRMLVFQGPEPGGEPPFALVKGEPEKAPRPIVRIHSECLTGDLLGSKRCDCRDQLSASLKIIQEEGCGLLIYLRQEGRGIGLTEKIKAYRYQEEGFDTVEANILLGHRADERDYAAAAAILKCLGISALRLLTNNPDKIVALERAGIAVERLPLVARLSEQNRKYMETKREKMGHAL
jgi:3,4-dihydroxy 2-butanone 4-phosphate synthase/GTP cyclohydrolase II